MAVPVLLTLPANDMMCLLSTLMFQLCLQPALPCIDDVVKYTCEHDLPCIDDVVKYTCGHLSSVIRRQSARWAAPATWVASGVADEFLCIKQMEAA